MGILSSNSTLIASHQNGTGNLFLSPLPGDASTANVSNQGTQNVTVSGGICRLGYVRLNNANQLRVAAVPISANMFFAALVRFPNYDQLDALNGYVRILETAGGTVNMNLTVRGGAYAAVASQQRVICSDVRQVNGSLGVATGNNTNRGYASTSGATIQSSGWDSLFGPYGRQNIRRRNQGWTWILLARSVAAVGTPASGQGVGLGTSGADLVRPNSHMAGFAMHRRMERLSSGEQLLSIGGMKIQGAAAADVPSTIAAADYIIGGTTGADVDMDLACMIMIDNPWSTMGMPEVMALLRGEGFEAFGATAGAATWKKHFGSLTKANEIGATVTVETGAPTFSATPTDGPLHNIQLGSVTPGNNANYPIANGTVSP